MILYVSPVPANGATGYGHIGTHLCTALNNYDKVICLSLDYRREEHYFDFTLVPTSSRDLITQANALVNNRASNVRLVILAMDIPMMLDLVQATNFGGVPKWGIFPVEAGPLCDTWANGLWNLNERFVISEFGKSVLDEASVPSRYLPIPVNSYYKPMANFDRTETLKELGIDPDAFVVITVADNQERKNLSAAFEIFSRFNKVVPNSNFILITRMDSKIGWNLDDLARTLGVRNKVRLLDRNVSFERMANLYRASNVLLITSKAEGLCLPIREAMACGLPAVGTDCTAMSEQLQAGGFAIPACSYVDPYGNSTRYFIDTDEALAVITQIYESNQCELAPIIEKGLEYAGSFTWEKSVAVLTEQLKTLK